MVVIGTPPAASSEFQFRRVSVTSPLLARRHARHIPFAHSRGTRNLRRRNQAREFHAKSLPAYDNIFPEKYVSYFCK